MKTTQADFIKDIFAITADYDGDGNGLFGESDEEVINLLKTEYPALFRAYELLKGENKK
jgi:hypothetical protein